MKIRLNFVALQLDHFPDEGKDTLDIEDGALLSDALNALDIGEDASFMTLVNGSAVPVSERAGVVLKEGDEVTLFTPLKGG